MNNVSQLIAGFALATALASTSVGAEDVPTKKVYFNDLDLSTDAGVRIFDNRIRHAIIRICGGRPGAGHIAALTTRRCRAATLADITPARDRTVRLARSGAKMEIVRLELRAVAGQLN